jgi:hypothetical protein
MFVITVQSKVDYSLVTYTMWAVRRVVWYLNTSHVSFVFTVLVGKFLWTLFISIVMMVHIVQPIKSNFLKA